MGFINNHEIRAMVEEDISLIALFYIINGNNLVGDITEHILVWT